MEKVDIAKLLRCCPEGMELDCTIWDNVKLHHIDNTCDYPIYITIEENCHEQLTKYGQWNHLTSSKCVIFPKGKTSWEDFVPPFKDGDICYVKTEHSESIFIFECINEFDFIKRYVSLRNDGLSADDGTVCQITSAKEFRLATEEEKKKLFDAIEANGYKWDDETKTLNKEFKDGDIIIRGRYIAIFWYIKPNGLIYYHCWYDTKYKDVRLEKDFGIGNINDKPMTRLATEEEKKKLFDAIEAKGYKWNEEIKTLDKLIEFKDGDIVYNRLQKRICIYHYREDETHCISYCRYNEHHKTFEILDGGDICIAKQDYRLATEEEKKTLFDAIEANGYKWDDETKTLEKLIIPKFKVGDIIQNEDAYKVKITEVNIEDECYGYEYIDIQGWSILLFSEQDNWKLVPNKFDVNNLKPFDKVLCRKNDNGIWECDIFSYYNEDELFYKFHCIGINYKYCIPYEGNEKLLGTTNDCDKFYKTWEE